jgi:hypothetical protein
MYMRTGSVVRPNSASTLASAAYHVDNVFDLLGIDDVIRQVIIDFGVGQEALFLAARNEFLQLLSLLAGANCCTFLAQEETPSM